MKRTEVNSLRRALGKGDAGPHPDADVMTAFAEDGLLLRERQSVLAHLAGCAECRDVLSIAGEAADPQASGMRIVTAKKRLAWGAGLTLLAAAALIAVVSTVIVRSVMKGPGQNVAVATKNTEPLAAHPVPPKPSTQPAGDDDRKHAARKTPAARAASAPALAPAQEASANAAPDQNPQEEVVRPATASGAVALPKMAARGPSPVNGFAGGLASRAASGANMSIGRPRWRINDLGQPERAFGQEPWRPVLPNGNARMQTLSISVGEVWVGGENSQVFRSLDNGASWRVVALPEKDGTSHTIAHIRLDSPQEITIIASDGTTWTTTDGGQSWK